jgi:hypothetical protein
MQHLRGEEIPLEKDVQEMSDPSSSRETETCATEQGYEADSEVTDFTEDLGQASRGRRKPPPKKRPPRKNPLNTIIYPELCRLALELIIKYKYNDERSVEKEDSVVLHVLLRLLTLAKASDDNACALYGQVSESCSTIVPLFELLFLRI